MMPRIVRIAMRKTVINIGQLTPEEVTALEAYVKKGWLAKGQGGGYPILKTVYAHPGYDFDAAREAAITRLQADCAAVGEKVNVKFQ